MARASFSKGRVWLVRGALLTFAALGAAGSQAAGQSHPAAVQAVPASLNGDARSDGTHAGMGAETLSRAELHRMFKARCPGRVEKLLGVALPTERPDFKVIADICICASTSMEAVPDSTTLGQFKAQAAQAALTCSKTTITTHNEMRTRKALGPYLSSQGLDAQQVAAFSQCAAATHWRNTVDAAQEGVRPEASAWWGPCTEQIGRKGLPEPQN